jgi:hypothetical protein
MKAEKGQDQKEQKNSRSGPGSKRVARITKGLLLFTALAVLPLLLFCIVNVYRLVFPDAWQYHPSYA